MLLSTRVSLFVEILTLLLQIWLGESYWNMTCLNRTSHTDLSPFDATVTLGMAVPLSGFLSQVPPIALIIKRKMKALEIYQRWVNNCKGGLDIGGSKYGIDIVFLDDEGDSEKTKNRTAELIDAYGANFIFPSMTPPLEIAGLEIGESRKVITMQETELEHCFGYDYCFSTRTHIGEMMESIIKALALRGAKNLVYFYGGEKHERPARQLGGDETLANITDGSDGSSGPETLELACYQIPQIIRSLPKNLRTIDVVWGEKSPSTMVELVATMQREINVGIDVLIGCNSACDLFIPVMKQSTLDAKAIVFPKCIDDAKHVALGEDGMYLLGPSQWDAKMEYKCSITGSTSQTFSDAFEKLYGILPAGTGAATFAGALALGEAAQAGGTLDSDELRYALSRLDVDSMFGALKFNALNMIDEEMAFHQIDENLEEQVVIPEDVATDTIIYPMKVWSVRECEIENGEGHCRCTEDGCPACTGTDYEFEVSDCHPTTELRYLKYHKLNFSDCEGGLSNPNDFKLACDYVPTISSTGSSIYAISIIGAIIASAYFFWFVLNRKQKVVVLAQPVFCLLFTFFGALFSLSTILFLGKTNAIKCHLRQWIFHLSFTGMVGALFVKVYRVWKLFGMKKLKKIKVTAAMMLKALSLLLAVDVVLLTLMSAITPPVPITHHHEITNIGIVPFVGCRPSLTFSSALMAYQIALVLVGCYFSYQIRSVSSQFSETKYIMFAMYSIALVLGICLIVSSQDVTIQLKLLLQGFGVSFSSMMALSAVVIPKIVIRHMQLRDFFTSMTTRTDPGISKSMTNPNHTGVGHQMVVVSSQVTGNQMSQGEESDEEKDYESLYRQALAQLEEMKARYVAMEKAKIASN